MEEKKIVEIKVSPLYVKMPNGGYEIAFPTIVAPKDEAVVIRPKMIMLSLKDLDAQYEELIEEEGNNA